MDKYRTTLDAEVEYISIIQTSTSPWKDIKVTYVWNKVGDINESVQMHCLIMLLFIALPNTIKSPLLHVHVGALQMQIETRNTINSKVNYFINGNFHSQN